MVVSIVSGNSPEYAVYGPWENQQTGWNWGNIPTHTAVQLTANANLVYALITSTDNYGYWEQIYNGQ
jgi:hypothetical protein